MSHLLIVELPGGNDTDLLHAARRRGDSFVFLTARAAHYRAQPAVQAWLDHAEALIEVASFDFDDVLQQVQALHAAHRFDALLCLIDIRLIEAARLAQALGLRYLNPASATLLRDKFSVRQRLQERGIAQADFRLATSNAALRQAVAELGLPVLIKPADGYGSQSIVLLRDQTDLDPLVSPLDELLPSRADYGLGVHANDRLLVERYMPGRFVGCDTLSVNGEHRLLGVHDKLMFEPPSFAMRGSTFAAGHAHLDAIRRHAFEVLDAVGFDHGAAHIEMMLTADGPRLVEINPRLVGAKLPRLLDMVRGGSVHADLIALHAGAPLPAAHTTGDAVAALRWIVTDRAGILADVTLPPAHDGRIRCVEILKSPGDAVRPPLENVDRIGYVMASGSPRAEIEAVAECAVVWARVRLREDLQAEATASPSSPPNSVAKLPA